MRRLLLLALLLCSCSVFSKLPPADRSHELEVRSDCKSWISVWVRDQGKITSISRFDYTRLSSLSALDAQLKSINILGPLSALRFKRIAERRQEPPLSESAVVEQFILAARDML